MTIDGEPAGPETETVEISNVVDELFGETGPISSTVETKTVEPVVEAVQPVVEAPASEALNGNQPSEPEKEPKFVPLGAVLDEREKRREAQDRAKQLEAELEKYKAPQSQPQTSQQLDIPQTIPDYLDDPDGHQHAVAQITAALQKQQAETERFAKARLEGGFVEAIRTLGQAETQAVFELMQTDPQASSFVVNHYNPAEAIKMVHAEIQRRQFLSQIPVGVDPNEWILQKAAELQAQ